MSLKSAQEAVVKLRTDPAFAKKLETAKTDPDRVKLMKDAGFDFTKDEFKKACQGMALPKHELSEQELAAVAGGSSASWTTTGTTIGVTTAAAAATF